MRCTREAAPSIFFASITEVVETGRNDMGRVEGLPVASMAVEPTEVRGRDVLLLDDPSTDPDEPDSHPAPTPGA
jgi:hypothetical protein